VSVAARFFDGRTGTAHAVIAHLQGTTLRIDGNDTAPLAAWPVAKIRRADGDISGATVTLRHTAGPERLELPDATLLADLRAAGASVAGPVSLGRRPLVALGAGFIAAVAIAAVLIDRLPSLLTPFVPHRLERAWSDQFEAAVLSSVPVCQGAAGSAAMHDLFARLATAAGLSSPPPIEVLDGSLVNAFTLPDGRVVVLRGLIDESQDSDELAGVLAHELGHVVHRDPTREMLRRLELDMTARSLGWGGGVASTITALSYGRSAEAAADASAIDTLHAAGLRADGLSRFFTMLQAKLGDAGDPAFLSDHPTTADRAARLRQPPTGAHALTDPAWHAVRQMCGT
jgi:predicted Zn-dependent protease